MSCLALPTSDDVRVVISTSLTDSQLDAMIVDAALMAEECDAIAGYSAERQASIIKWITAHLISTVKNNGAGALTSDKLGDAAQTFASGHLGTNLRSTSYGLAALQLDSSGCLARIGRAKASIQKV